MGVIWFAFALLMYVLLSFHSPLRPVFTTTEIVSFLFVIAFVILRG